MKKWFRIIQENNQWQVRFYDDKHDMTISVLTHMPKNENPSDYVLLDRCEIALLSVGCKMPPIATIKIIRKGKSK